MIFEEKKGQKNDLNFTNRIAYFPKQVLAFIQNIFDITNNNGLHLSAQLFIHSSFTLGDCKLLM